MKDNVSKKKKKKKWKEKYDERKCEYKDVGFI